MPSNRAIVLVFLAVLTHAAEPPKPTSHTKKDIEGWTVQVDDRLNVNRRPLLRECQQAPRPVAGQVVANLASGSRGVPHLHRLSYHVEVPCLEDGRLWIDAVTYRRTARLHSSLFEVARLQREIMSSHSPALNQPTTKRKTQEDT